MTRRGGLLGLRNVTVTNQTNVTVVAAAAPPVQPPIGSPVDVLTTLGTQRMFLPAAQFGPSAIISIVERSHG